MSVLIYHMRKIRRNKSQTMQIVEFDVEYIVEPKAKEIIFISEDGDEEVVLEAEIYDPVERRIAWLMSEIVRLEDKVEKYEEEFE